ncbi:MAG: hypothetical protein MUE46_09670 [Xanthomonadales bacterium]|jgi:hypothetical protein|nr:hypothetical protein [Xanthomonadales bacterium]
MNRWAVGLLALGIAGGVWHLIDAPPRAIHPGPGIQAPEEPIQRPSPDAALIRHGAYTLEPRAHFDITARLLSSQRYFADRGAALSPIDWALGWGRMSDDAVLDQLKVAQGGRFFTYRWHLQPPIPAEEIVRSVTNTHLIPANDAIWRQLKRIPAGRVVRIEGLLVDAADDDGFRWKSSLTRNDTGAGACELIYVQSVSVLR